MKIGIGITTTQSRPKTLATALKHHKRHEIDEEGVEHCMHLQTFYPQKHKSIAEVKNLCLRELMRQECDYIYLFDDDCFPVHDDWWKPFIEAHLRTQQHHFLYLLDDTHKLPWGMARKKLKEEDGVTIFRNCQGCCIFLTKYAVIMAGGFDEEFGLYGFEHEQYSMRIHQLGMNTFGPFLSVPGIEQYIYSLDIQGTEPYLSQLGNEVDPKTGRLKSAGSVLKMKISLEKNEAIYKSPRPLYQAL